MSLTRLRRFETKLGERLNVVGNKLDPEESLQDEKIKYVIFGVPEDIGVKANLGIGGADSAWLTFLHAFLNIQSNDFLEGSDVLLLGHFNFGEIAELIDNNAATPDEKIEAYRHAVNFIDEQVEALIKIITQHKKIPIVIGGGHNNAYPALKGAAKGLHKAEVLQFAQLNCINLDAHSDYRATEGRHSGNGFRYAKEDSFLNKYFALGVHENYLQQNVWSEMVNDRSISYITYEDIFIHEKRNFRQALTDAVNFTGESYCGIELDLDVIENVLSSAVSPCGINVLHARQFINYVATYSEVAYLHICEGASRLADGRQDSGIGKILSYLVSDFIKAHSLSTLNQKT